MSQQPWGTPQPQPTRQPWPAQGQWPAPAGQPWPAQQAWPPQPGPYPQPWPPQAPQPQGQQPWPPTQASYQPGPFQQAPYPQGYPPFPPPRPPRSNPARLLVPLLLVPFFLIVVPALISVVSGLGGSTPTPPVPPKTPTPGATQAPERPYENESYQAPPVNTSPPDLPVPQTRSQAIDFLESNPIYRKSVPSPTKCAMGRVDPLTASSSQLEKHMNDLMACLMATWDKPVAEAGFEMPRPPVTVYTSSVRTACGVLDEVNASYCAADQRIYYAKGLMNAMPRTVRNIPYAMETILAHEFGHAVQARTGILISERALSQELTKAEARVMSRRTEVQADCLAAQFVQSAAQSQNLTSADLDQLRKFTFNLGDDILSGDPNIDADHGSSKSRERWFTTGLKGSSVGACNSYVAPASQVR